MEKEIPKQESWVPETPEKPTSPARPKPVYVERNLLLPEKVCNKAPMTSAVTSSSGRKSASLVFNWRGTEACISAVFTQLLGQNDGNSKNVLLTNSPESHLPQNDGQHLHENVGTGGSTPFLKQNLKTKRPKKGPQQKPKVKKHTPKVVVDFDGKSKRTPKPKTPKLATPKRASFKRNLNLSKKSQKASVVKDDSSQKSCVTENDVIGESCRRALNFDLGNQSRDESAITTAIHQYQFQNRSVDNSEFPNKLQNDINLGSSYGEPCRWALNCDLGNLSRDESATTTAIHQYQFQNNSAEHSEWPNKLQNDINLGSSYREPTDIKQAKSSGYCQKFYKRIFRCLRNSRKSGPIFPTSKRSKRKPAHNGSMWMFPPRKTRTKVAVKKAKSFKCMLTLTQSTVYTRRKRTKRYNRRHNLASLTAIPICDQLPKTLKQAQTIERDGIAFRTENDEKQGFEIIRPEACNISEGSPLEDVSKSRGPYAESESLRTDPIMEHDALRVIHQVEFDTLKSLDLSLPPDPIVEHDALGVTHQVNSDTFKSSEPPVDPNLSIVDLNAGALQFLDISNGGHQIMADFSMKAEPPIAIMEKDHNADSQYGTIVSKPIKIRKQQKPHKKQPGALVPLQPGALVPHQKATASTKEWQSLIDLDTESLSMWNLLTNDSESLRMSIRELLTKDFDALSTWKLLTNIDKGKDEEKQDKEKEKWWERERNVFRGRIDSFTARMHLILGDRRFKPWKGSVVDSVVGVFLTQNVSDHSSSSVFISLAARFPLQSTSNRGASNNNLEITNSQESSGSNMTYDGLACDLGGNQYFVSEPEPEPNTSHGPETRAATSLARVEGTNLVDTEDSGAVKDAVVTHIYEGCCSRIHLFPDFSSEADLASLCKPCSMGSSTTTTELSEFKNTTLFSSEADLASPCKPYSMESSTSSSEFSEFKNTTLLQESYSNGKLKCDESPHNGCTALRGMEYGNQTSGLDRSNDLNSADAFISLSDSQDPFENSLYSMDHPEILEDQGKCSVVTDCSSQIEVETEKNSQTCNSYQTKNFRSQPISFVDGQVESKNSEMKPADDATHINNKRKRRTGKTPKSIGKTKTATPRRKAKEVKDEEIKREVQIKFWEIVRKFFSKARPRSSDQMDSVDWEAVRHADVREIAKAIKLRGQENIIAQRIKDFLNRVVEFHGIGIDLEWLHDLPPDFAKEYLIQIKGLGLKSVECLRLLSLQHKGFPVDTNVARVVVRLGWVPLQPLPEELELHLLEKYPVMDSIQKYLWPRLCNLDQRTLYELHYHFITFGKAICTKKNPNCNACPMRAECKHFASAFASARLALPGPSEKRMVSSTVPIAAVENPAVVVNPKSVSLLEANPVSESGHQTNYGEPDVEEPTPEPECLVSLLEANLVSESGYQTNYGEPIIEEPSSPEPECSKSLELPDIEDYPYDDPKEIPTLKINERVFKANLLDYLKGNMMLQNGDLSSALVAVTAEAASIPMPKLKNISRLRTEHLVFVLPDGHPITELLQLEKREKDDPNQYLFAIWTPGETANSLEPPKPRCNSNGSEPCKDEACFTCNCDREKKSGIARGTILIPSRTATRGFFPLNGTYFQVNEVFADDETSNFPIDVPWIWLDGLFTKTVYFGTSATSILKGLSTEAIQQCFLEGFICVRGFNRKEQVTKNLVYRFHCSANKKAGLETKKRANKKGKMKEIIDEEEMSKVLYIMDAPPLDDTRGKN